MRTSVSARTVRRVERATGTLATAAMEEMGRTLPWFAAMPAEQRSWIGLVAQAGIQHFVQWLRSAGRGPEISDVVFGVAPRELARAVSLQQTVDMVRVTVGVVEQRVDELAAAGEQERLLESVLRYSREIGFAAAQVYARAAEERGAWDARLEALVLDGLLRGEADELLLSRVSALGWTSTGPAAVVVGTPGPGEPEAVVSALQRTARRAGFDVLAGVHGERLVVVVGAAHDLESVASQVAEQFGAGPVVVGPVVAGIGEAGHSAQVALAGLRAAAAWPGAPRPVPADALLPERALDDDPIARRQLVEDVYQPLRKAGADVLDTVSTYLEQAGSLEGTGRALFVHTNTVRYRLRRAHELTGHNATHPRAAFTLRVAIALGRLAEHPLDL